MITAWEPTPLRVQVPLKTEELLHYPNAVLGRVGLRLSVLSDAYPRGPFFLTLLRRLP